MTLLPTCAGTNTKPAELRQTQPWPEYEEWRLEGRCPACAAWHPVYQQHRGPAAYVLAYHPPGETTD